MGTEKEVSNKPRKRRSGIGKIFWLIILLALIIYCLNLLNLPQKLGIIPSPTEKLISDTFDPDGAKQLEDEFTKAGINLTGIDIGVIPYKDREGNLVAFILDTSKGFKPPTSDTVNPIKLFLHFHR